jgi:hypothetical protein
MSSLARGLGLGLVSVCCLGVMGCGENNESVVDKQARDTAGASVPTTPPPKSQAEFGQRSQTGGSQNKASHYPGARQ